MPDFLLYFQLGLEHICDWKGYDHILFVTVLCGIYQLSDWKKVLVLITAFTIGHSITLALSVFQIIRINTSVIEFLIPVTIVLTALNNIGKRSIRQNPISLTYFLTLFFGLIHGLGFSSYLKSLLGRSTSIIAELFAFNIGLECGQILIVISVLLLAFLLIRTFKIKPTDWSFFLSSAIFGIALIMCIDRFQQIHFR
ncbi:MAG: HupE/UreJ family protein [Sphingobacteriaceae bacterium]|nr:MAG: HupE/UreJ family protein [Sphingobacteriaceae bacterium]